MSSKTLSIALFALIVLGLSTNVLLYLQVQQIQEKRNFLEPKLAELQADLTNVTSQLSETRRSVSKTVHVRTLSWGRQLISAGEKIEGYVGSWIIEKAVKIVHIEVWMGNPYDVLWEGDTFVSLDNTIDLWSPPPDTVLVHYQFDSHEKSPVPHQKSFDLRPGFYIDAGETLYVYRLFNNFDVKATNASDGWVMLYYTWE